MKRIVIISSIVLGCTLQAVAQVTESSYVLGTSTSFYLTTFPNNGKISQVSFAINPTVGKFVSEKWLMSAGLGYSIRRQNFSYNLSNVSSSSQNFSAMFGMTRFYPLSEKMYFTCDYMVLGGYTLYKNEFIQDSLIVKSQSSEFSPSLNFSPGLAYFLNKKWMIYTSFGSLRYAYDYGIESKAGRHSLMYDLQTNSFGIGARYILGTEKN